MIECFNSRIEDVLQTSASAQARSWSRHSFAGSRGRMTLAGSVCNGQFRQSVLKGPTPTDALKG